MLRHGPRVEHTHRVLAPLRAEINFKSPILRIAKVAILGWGISRFLLVLADFFTPGFEVLFHLCHELVGYCAVDQAMIVA